MNTETAKASVGKLVMSRDAGFKMIDSVPYYHGPYKLLKITKEGTAILEGRESHLRVRTSLLKPLNLENM